MGFSVKDMVSSRRDRPRRIILLGEQKVGKSTFASQAPGPAFIPVKGEEGIDDLDAMTFPMVEAFGDLMEALESLYVDEHDYKTLVIDSVSTLEGVIWDEIERRNGGIPIAKIGGGFQVGYSEAMKLWRQVTEAIDALRSHRNMGCILVGHVKVEKFNDPTADPYDRYYSDLHKYASAYLIKWADGVAFAGHKTFVKSKDVGFGKEQSRAIDSTDGEPRLFTQKRPSHPGGGRGPWGCLPYELPLIYADFEEAWEAAKATYDAK